MEAGVNLNHAKVPGGKVFSPVSTFFHYQLLRPANLAFAVYSA